MEKKYQIFKIKKDYPNVYIFLKENNFSENYIKNLRKIMGNIKINDEDVTINHKLKIDDTLAIISNPNPKTTIMQCMIPLDIVYEDEYYLIVNKPSGIACMPSKSHYTYNLAGAICYYMQDKDDNFTLRIINRLDKDTAGIVIIAKDSISQKDIKNIDKTYYALCEGKIEKDTIINKKIKTITNNGVNENKRIIAEDGKDAITYVYPKKVIIDQLNNNFITLVKLKIIHGRTHQIRVHMSSIGHSLLGDSLYGKHYNKLSHAMLVCKEISFFHPYLNRQISISIPFPSEFNKLILRQ